jgi:hypothetical protein
MRATAMLLASLMLVSAPAMAGAQVRPDPQELAFRRATELRNAGIGATFGGAAAAGLGAGLIVAGSRVAARDTTGKEEGSGLLSGVGYLFAVVGAASLVTGIVLWVRGERERGRLRPLKVGRLSVDLDATGLRGTF